MNVKFSKIQRNFVKFNDIPSNSMELHTSPIQETLCQRTPPMRENTSFQSLKEKQEPQHQGCGE